MSRDWNQINREVVLAYKAAYARHRDMKYTAESPHDTIVKALASVNLEILHADPALGGQARVVILDKEADLVYEMEIQG